MLKIDEIDNYENAVSYIMMIPRFSGKNSIEDTKAFYSFLQEPGSSASIIHVAGTNGKGSVCAFLNSLLSVMGKKTGVFTSPHLVDVEERICINDKPITKQEFYELFCEMRNELIQYKKTMPEREEYHPSFFEFLFFMAMLYFEKKQVDSIILETGLGGRLDATNVIHKADACVITEIGYDHMEYLGDTLEQIASEKAGIILNGTPVIFWDKQKESTRIIREIAEKKNAPCISVSKENGNLNGIHDKDIDFSYKSRYYEYVRLQCHTSALYQMENALLALTTLEQIYTEKEISVQLLKDGISGMHWEGRMEEILPGVYLDGAHNEDGMNAFLHTVSLTPCMGNRHLLFSAVSDKRADKMAESILDSRLFYDIIIVRMQNSRGITTQELMKLFQNHSNVFICDSPETALEQLLQNKKEEDHIYIAGSLYLVGQIKQRISQGRA